MSDKHHDTLPPTPEGEKDFKDKMGKWRTMSLFYERKHPHYEAYWSLKDYDSNYKGTIFPSLKKIFLEYEHVPGYEYEFAMEVLGGWDHWLRMCNSEVGTHIAKWRAELDVKIKASGMRKIIKEATWGEGSSSLNAAKYLSDKGYAPTRGRPSKLEKERIAKEEKQVNAELEDDMARVGLKSIK